MTASAFESHSLTRQILADRYRVGRELAKGGMSTIYEAKHLRLGIRVAIKVLSPPFAQNPLVVARFVNEARVLALLDHPNVIRIIDFDRVEQMPYIVLERLVGETLSVRLASGKVPLEVAVRIAAQVGSALSAAHERGIVHRDLKPDNVFLSPRRDSLVVKVLDFGISRFVQGGSESRVTQELEVVGTPEYMAPEQAQGRGDVDARADQYSLALVAYEMITGYSPFADDHPEESLRRVVVEKPPLANRLDPVLSPGVAAVLERALSKVPGDRYASVDDFIAALSYVSGVRRPYSIAPEVNRDPGGVEGDPDTVPTAKFRPQPIANDTTPASVSGARDAVPEDVLRTLLGTIERIKTSLDSGQVHAAASLAMTTLDASERLTDSAAQSLVELGKGVFEAAFRARLAPLDRAVLVARDRIGARRSESPAAAFLLAHVDDWMTIDDILDVAGPLRLATLRVLIEMEEQGVVRFPRASTWRAPAVKSTAPAAKSAGLQTSGGAYAPPSVPRKLG